MTAISALNGVWAGVVGVGLVDFGGLAAVGLLLGDVVAGFDVELVGVELVVLVPVVDKGVVVDAPDFKDDVWLLLLWFNEAAAAREFD